MNKLRFLAGLALLPISLFSQQMTEILGRPTNNSITINVLFDSQVETYFEYSTNKGNYPNQTAIITSIIGKPVETKIEGLMAATRYYYRTRYRKMGQLIFLASPEHTFITQRKSGSTFRFTVEADPHPYDKKGFWPLWDICLANQLNDTADFMLDMGDTFGDDHDPFTITNSEVQQLQLSCRNFFGKVCHSLPFFFCIGNHEGESGYYLLQSPPNNLAMYETNWRKLYYPNPYPDGFYSGDTTQEANGVGDAENYFAWQWGDALFVVLDAYRYAVTSEKPQKWDFTIGKTQYDWFKKTLETSTAKYKFVFAHHILGQGRGGVELAKNFEWGGYDATKYLFDTKRPGWGLPLHQLMVKNKVDIFFQGHDHIYVKQELDSIIYQSVQMPSDSSYKIGVTDNGDAYLSGKQLNGSGHLRVTVSPDSVYVEYVSAVLPRHENDTLKNRMIRDNYAIVKKTPKTAICSLTKNEDSLAIKCKVYPNPATNSIYVYLSESPKNILTAQLINMNGSVVKQIYWNSVVGIPNSFNINLNENTNGSVTPGVYALRLFSDNWSAINTIVIK
jgi:hypothetical protein